MKQISDLKERQSIALGVLEHLKSFCESNSIKFMLAYGTLLGAVRHRGFIPWDDDVDVMMTRKEYMKFVSLYDNNKQDRYKFLCVENTPEYFAPLAKIFDNTTIIKQLYGQIEKTEYGIYVDIFVIDDMPDDAILAERFYKKADHLRLMWGMAVRSFSAPYSSIFSLLTRTPIMVLSKFLGVSYWLRKYNQFSCRYNECETNHSGIVIFGEGFRKEYVEKGNYTQYSIVSFEGKEYLAPQNTDYILTKLYNDYMSIPDEKDRKIHPSNAYYK